MTNNSKLRWTHRPHCETYTADAGCGYYEVVEYRNGEWGAKYSRAAESGKPLDERFVPSAGTYAKTADEAKSFCEAHWEARR